MTLHMLHYSLRCFARLRRNPVQRAFYSNAESNTQGSQNRTYLIRPLHVFLGAQAPRMLSCIKCVCSYHSASYILVIWTGVGGAVGLGAVLHGLLQAEVGDATPKPCSQCCIQRALDCACDSACKNHLHLYTFTDDTTGIGTALQDVPSAFRPSTDSARPGAVECGWPTNQHRSFLDLIQLGRRARDEVRLDQFRSAYQAFCQQRRGHLCVAEWKSTGVTAICTWEASM